MEELALSQWGLRVKELDEIALADLARSYIRRKRFEARMIAVQVETTLFGKSDHQGVKEVPLEAMMAMTGVDWDN